MARRFSRYRFAKKASGGAAQAGSALEHFIKYEKGEVKVEYARGADSKTQGVVQVIICPFGADEGILYAVRMSKRSYDKASPATGSTSLITNKGLFNHQTRAETEDVVPVSSSFVPAKAIIHVSGSGTSTETSKITAQKYNKETGAASYTIPFGGSKTTGADRHFLTVARAINTGVTAKNAEYTCTFTPEIFRGL